MKHKILFFALFLFILNSAFAQFGYLDKTFSNDGIAELNTGVQKRQNSQSTQVIPNTDGSLLILFQSSAQSLLIKKFANGVTDSSYGINGLSVPVPVQGSKAVKQPDGKIIIVGHTGSMPLHDNSGEYPEEKGTFINEDFALTRLNTDGSLDLAFGNKGLQKTDFSTYYDAINSVAIQPDGKILVSGITALYSPVPDADGFDTHLYDRVAVARYTNIGLPDLSFDGDGKFITNIRTNDLTSNLIALQSDGKFIIAASDTTGFSLARFTNTGSSDNSFAFSDKLLRPDGSYFAVRSLVVQSDDKIVLGGLWNNTNTQKDFVIVRYGANGALDKSFNTTGIKTTDFRGYNDYNTSLFIQKDGKVIAGGYASNGTSYAFATSRYNTNGSTDSTYSADGEQVSYHGSNDLRTAGLSLQPDGKIILAGFDGTPFFSITNTVVARYNTDGSLDKTFNKTGGLIYEFKIGNTVFKSSVVQPDGKLIAAGYTWNGTDNDFLLVRYNIDGSLDNSFGIDGKNPFAISVISGFAKNISAIKHIPIIATSEIINASTFRIPKLRRNNNKKVSSTVMVTPHVSGNPNSNCIPIAIPNTSARSQAAIAISASMYKNIFMNGG